MFAAAPVVQTTGVNWDAVLATTAAVAVILGFVGGIIVLVVRRGVRDEIRLVIGSDVTPQLVHLEGRLDSMDARLNSHDADIARLRGIDEGRNQAIAQARMSRDREPL